MERSRRTGVISGHAAVGVRLGHDEEVNCTTSVVTAEIVTMASGKCSLSFISSFACNCSAKYTSKLDVIVTEAALALIEIVVKACV